jgi:small-conductance mechanosensitive channel
MLPYLTRTFRLPPLLAYVIVLAGLAIATGVLGFILHRIFHRWARRLQGAWSAVAVEVLESLALPLLLAAALDIALDALSLPPRYDKLAARFIFAVVLGVVFNFLGRAAALLLRGLSQKDPGFLRITQPATVAVRVIFGFLALVIFLDNIGVSLTAVWTTLGVGSVAIGLALQATLSNFFAGLNILADRAVSPGDHIKLSTGVEGDVMRIGWRATELRTAANEITLVPNSTMASANIINYSLPGLASMASLSVKVNPSSEVGEVEKVLLETAQNVARRYNGADGPPPQLSFNSSLGDPVLQFTLSVPVADGSQRDAVAGTLRAEIANRYREGKLQRPS